MTSRIAKIIHHLDLAFGGRSQWGPDDLGRAIAGQTNNNGLGGIADLPSLCIAAAEATADDDFDGLDASAIEAAARSSLRSMGLPA